MLGAARNNSERYAVETLPPNPADEIKARYEIDFKWRKAWGDLANKIEPDRLQSRQEAIERKAKLANNRIRVLMRRFDAECT